MLLEMRMAFLCRLGFAVGNCQKATTHCVISVCNNGGWGLVIKTDNMSGFLWQGWRCGKNFLTSVNVAVCLPGRSFESSPITLGVLHIWPCSSEIAVCSLSSLSVTVLNSYANSCNSVLGVHWRQCQVEVQGDPYVFKENIEGWEFWLLGNSHGGLSLQWL